MKKILMLIVVLFSVFLSSCGVNIIITGDQHTESSSSEVTSTMTTTSTKGVVAQSTTKKAASRETTKKATVAVTKEQTMTVTSSTSHSHSFVDFRCTGCGEMDHAHAYEYFVALVKSRGKAFGNQVELDIHGDGAVFLTYDYDYDRLFLSNSDNTVNGFRYSSLLLDNYFYGTSFRGLGKIDGFIDPKTYRKNTPIIDYEYDGPEDAKYFVMEAARLETVYFVEVLNNIAKSQGFFLEDFGFLAFDK